MNEQSIKNQIIGTVIGALILATIYQIWSANHNFKALNENFEHTVSEITLITDHLADRIETQEKYLTKLNDIKIDHLYASVTDIKKQLEER